MTAFDLDGINNRISKEICYDAIDKITDANLLGEYKQCKSVTKNICKLQKILNKHDIKEDVQCKIINDFIQELIPAGTKGVVRGNTFNKIVKHTIENLKLDTKQFEICFSKHCDVITTTERTGKVIIGMNQLDLWKGGQAKRAGDSGQQLNRGSNYLIDNNLNTTTSKLLCVVCNEIKFKKYKKESV